MLERSTRPAGACVPGASRSSGGQYGRPSRSNKVSSSCASGSGSSARTYSRRARRAEELRAEHRRLCHDERHRHAVQREPDRTPLLALEHRHDRRERGERRDGCVRVLRCDDDRELVRQLAEPTCGAGDLAAERGRDRGRELPAPVDGERTRRLRLTLERRPDLQLGRRTDPGRVPQTARGDRSLELCDGRHVEIAGNAEDPFRGEAEQPAEADELGLELRLELAEFGDLSCLDELAQLRLDPRADAPQLANAALPHELRDRRRGGPDQLGGAHVRAHGERARLGELEQRREKREPVCDLRVRGRHVRHDEIVPRRLALRRARLFAESL